MNNLRLKKYFWLAASVAAALQGHAASAACLSGTLGGEAGAIAVHNASCPAGDTTRLAFQVRNGTASSPRLSAQAHKVSKAANTTDPTAGDANYSPLAYVADGSGTYVITVDKSTAGSAPVSYDLFYQCETPGSTSEAGSCGIGGQEPVALTPPVVAYEVKEGETAANSLQIEQGCYSGAAARPVIAQSVLFPTDDANSDSFRSDNDAPVNLSDVVANPDGLANLVAPAQDKSAFFAQAPKRDAGGRTVGFHSTKGKLPTDLTGQVPFLFTGPDFRADSCARKLLVKIAVADICRRSAVPAAGDVNLWLPNKTPKFANGALIPGSTDSARSGSPATLTVNRTTPLDAGCGAGYDVTVWPADSYIDTYLPIPGHWLK